VLGLITPFLNSRRIPKLGALVKPATLFKFHKAGLQEVVWVV
jgi:hypothetical protein